MGNETRSDSSRALMLLITEGITHSAQNNSHITQNFKDNLGIPLRIKTMVIGMR